MIALLGSLVLLLLTAAVVLAAAVGVTAVPFVLSVDMAERRGFSAARWGLVQLALLALAALAVLKLKHAGPLVVAPLVLTWFTPLVLALLGTSEAGIGGPQGRHER